MAWTGLAAGPASLPPRVERLLGPPQEEREQEDRDREAEEWKARLEGLDGVTSVQAESAGFYRVLTSSGSRTTMQLVELAASLGETLTSLSVQNTTLDDVFVHYTGRQLRDEQVKPPVFTLPPRPGARP